jgi:hypothetical protein
VLDARDWGAQLRFSAPPSLVEKFYDESAVRLVPFTLYGSGDFHYLSALWLRRLARPVVLISFDNHPDWDIRPPKWGCGGWINRALELPQIHHVAIWGCGNFECWWPHNIFANRKAEGEGRLEVHPWADHRPSKDRQRAGAIVRESWRGAFQEFAATLTNANVYITIDLDCLSGTEIVANWETGFFSVADLQWALAQLKQHARVAGGDICGGYSEPKYARWKQKFASEWDHPKLELPDVDKIQKMNFAALEKLWPALAQ